MFRLELMTDEFRNHGVAVRFVGFVDADHVTRIGVQYLATADRVREEQRMH
jgi:hypothetical protein